MYHETLKHWTKAPAWEEPADEQELPEITQWFDSEINEAMELAPECWIAFFGNEGDHIGFYPEAERISPAKFHDADFNALTFDQLIVLLMAGTNQQCLQARHELRQRAFSAKEFLDTKQAMWDRMVRASR